MGASFRLGVGRLNCNDRAVVIGVVAGVGYGAGVGCDKLNVSMTLVRDLGCECR